MFAGFTLFTWVHTLLSLVALAAGYVVVRELLASRVPSGWTALFIATAVLTSATGFGFTVDSLGASHWVGLISLVLLAGAGAALYLFDLAGPWRPIYAITQVLAQYFLVFVLVAQLFKKMPALAALAPTLAEPPFAVAQTVVLVAFGILAVAAAVKFRPLAVATA